MSVLEDGEEGWTITAGGGCGVFLFRFNTIFTLCVGKSRPKGASDVFQVTSRRGHNLGQKPLISAFFQTGREACDKTPPDPGQVAWGP